MPGLPEMLIILVMVMMFFGIGKLPKVLGQMGRGVKEFRKGMKDAEDEPSLIPSDPVEAENATVVDAQEVRN